VLRSLTVEPLEKGDLPDITFFNAFPALQHFELSRAYYAEALMDLFINWDGKSSEPGATPFCPDLQSMTLFISPVFSEGDILLAKLHSFLGTRVAMKRPLQKLVLIGGRFPLYTYTYNLQPFDSLQVYGVEVVVKQIRYK
jgi:hypothetical protein